MRCRNEIAPVIGRSTGATGNNTGLGGPHNDKHLVTSQSRIGFLGQRLIQAYQAGDREAAIRHQADMVAAIKRQAEPVKAARLREIDAAISAGDGCYFMDAGDRDRARLAREGGTA